MMRVESLEKIKKRGESVVFVCDCWNVCSENSLVGLLGEGVELSDGVIEGLLGEVASSVGAVQDLVADEVIERKGKGTQM